MKKQSIITLIILTMISSLLGGCVKDDKSEKLSDSSNKIELEEVKIIQPVYNELWAPAYLAKTLGFYEEEGLNVEFITAEGPALMPALVGGQADIGLLGYEMMLMMAEQGKSTKMIAATTSKYPYSLVAREEYKEIKDLKGKNVVGAGPGSSPRAFVMAAMEYGGIKPNDVNYMNVQQSNTAFALEKDEIQATFAAAGSELKRLIDVGGHVLVDIKDDKVHEQLVGSPTYEMYIAAVMDKTVEEKPEMIQKFANALYKSIEWYKNNSAENIADELMKILPDGDRDELIAGIEISKPFISETGQFTESGHEAANKITQKVGMTKGYIEMSDVVDNSFIKKAMENYKK